MYIMIVDMISNMYVFHTQFQACTRLQALHLAFDHLLLCSIPCDPSKSNGYVEWVGGYHVNSIGTLNHQNVDWHPNCFCGFPLKMLIFAAKQWRSEPSFLSLTRGCQRDLRSLEN